MTNRVILMCGIPGSGKSTYIEKRCHELDEEHITNVCISRDTVRKNMTNGAQGDDYFSKEKAVFKEFVRQINEAMELGIEEVYIDATHINEKSRAKVLRCLRPDPRTKLIVKVVDTPYEECLHRNSLREGFAKVPEGAIKSMYDSFTIPSLDEFPENKYGFKTIEIS